MKKRKSTTITFRSTVELRDWLRDLADEDRRSISDKVFLILEQMMEDQKEPVSGPPKNFAPSY